MKSKNKVKIILYLVLRILVIVIMTISLLKKDYDNVFLCVLTLILFMIPTFVDKRLNIKLPSLLEYILILFIFSAEILGELSGFYIKFPHWDTLLHTLNGFIMAAIGFAMIDILNRTPSLHFNMSPVFVALMAFCFSMTIGVLWEFFEYGADRITYTDMQKDSIQYHISSVKLNPDMENSAKIITDIEKTTITGKVDGKKQEITVDGYLDIGLRDTMSDLIVNCIGAVIFSVFGLLYLKGRSRFILKFIPEIKNPEEDLE